MSTVDRGSIMIRIAEHGRTISVRRKKGACPMCDRVGSMDRVREADGSVFEWHFGCRLCGAVLVWLPVERLWSVVVGAIYSED